jgi:hypothetical protein
VQTQLLIDSIVRQTTVLIAQLATSGGVRAPLAHVAGQVFVELARELETQGVSRKVSADMFGMALRTYQRKTQRLRESVTMRGRSLWEAVLEFLQSEDVVPRSRVLSRFRHDDQVLVRGVLRDLTESGFVFASGSGDGTAFRAARPEELAKLRDAEDSGALDALVWGIIYREGPIDRAGLTEGGRLSAEALAGALERLLSQGRIEVSERGGEALYASRELFIPLDATVGWEAAVYDHFRALVSTICRKLALPATAREQDLTGGSTYSFAVWSGHPHEDEVTATLKRFRAEQSALRAKVDAFNAAHGIPEAQRRTVITYAGQHLVDAEGDDAMGGADGDDAMGGADGDDALGSGASKEPRESQT